MGTTIVKLPIHEHPLFSSARFMSGPCAGCHTNENIYTDYFCNEFECKGSIWFHKECAEAPLEINHPLHTQHPLMLTSDSVDGPCDMCGQKLLPPCYSCSTCKFNIDLTCGMKPLPHAIQQPVCHYHPLTFLKKREEESPCEICKKSIFGPSYSCLECNNVYFHVGCVNLSNEVNHPCHFTHPLKYIASDTLTDDAERDCLTCGGRPENVLYHCSICNFTTCLDCFKNPPPRVITHIKTHKHPLICLSKRISYICDVCGLEGNMVPYICVKCGFVIHRMCIDLPEVININRHDHRVSFIHHLGTGDSKCGVCRKSLSKYHGAYLFSVCPNYAVHIECAVTSNVWDGIELEDIPDDTKYIAPFKVVGENLITHFCHEKHTLKLYKNYIPPREWLHCKACIYPLGFDSIYSCEECCFILHEMCANLPVKKRLVFDIAQFTLEVGTRFLNCNMCRTLSQGLLYITQGNYWAVDVHCGSLFEPLFYYGHLHPLYFYGNKGRYCDGCHDIVNGYVLHCDACDFVLCFYCASLPEKICHMNDEHPLTLYCGEKMSDNNWCNNCERELDPCKWFYTCTKCGVTLHAQCVLGDFSHLKLEFIITYNEKCFKVVPNIYSTRPLCIQCHSRCKFSIILKHKDNGYVCSRSCLLSFMGI